METVDGKNKILIQKINTKKINPKECKTDELKSNYDSDSLTFSSKCEHWAAACTQKELECIKIPIEKIWNKIINKIIKIIFFW